MPERNREPRSASIQTHLAGRGLAHYARFVAVGVFNTAIGYGTYLLLLFAGLQYWAAWAMALVVSLIAGFLSAGRLVFDRTEAWRFPLYGLTWFAIYGVNIALMIQLMKLGIGERMAPIVLAPLNVVLSYVAQRWFVFSGGLFCSPKRAKQP